MYFAKLALNDIRHRTERDVAPPFGYHWTEQNGNVSTAERKQNGNFSMSPTVFTSSCCG